MKIIGAGMAGLIAGHMMRRHCPTILEASEKLPNNHSALLRFRSDAVSNATSIPFERVHVRKGVKQRDGIDVRNEASIPDINSYAEKVSGTITTRSIGNVSCCDRWVAPPDFSQKLAASLPCGIEFNTRLDPLLLGSKDPNEVWISTIPMPLMMKIAGWQTECSFEHKEISTIVAEISSPLTSVYQTVYLPYQCVWGNFYRASLHGSQLIIEGVGSPNIQYADQFEDGMAADSAIARKALQELFGIRMPVVKSVTRKAQKFGKIIPIDEGHRERFILWLTEKYNIYSLGRFATWRPILLDDIVNDIAVIDRLMSKSAYTRRKH